MTKSCSRLADRQTDKRYRQHCEHRDAITYNDRWRVHVHDSVIEFVWNTSRSGKARVAPCPANRYIRYRPSIM